VQCHRTNAETHPPTNSCVWACERTTPTARPHTSRPFRCSTAACARRGMSTRAQAAHMRHLAAAHRGGVCADVAHERKALAEPRLGVAHHPNLARGASARGTAQRAAGASARTSAMSPATEKVACRSSSVASTARPPTNTSVAAWRAQGAQRTRQPRGLRMAAAFLARRGLQARSASTHPLGRRHAWSRRLRAHDASQRACSKRSRHSACACLGRARNSGRSVIVVLVVVIILVAACILVARVRGRGVAAVVLGSVRAGRRRLLLLLLLLFCAARLLVRHAERTACGCQTSPSRESPRRESSWRGGAHLTAFPPPKRLTRARAARCRQQRPTRVCAGSARSMLLLRPAPAVRCRGRAPLVTRAAAGDAAPAEQPLAARVLSALNASAGSSGASRSRIALLDDALLSPDVVFSDDFGTTLSGRDAYAGAAARWAAAHGAELGPELRWQPLRCASTGPEQLLLQWEATWIPEQMAPLVRFGRSVGWEVRRSLCLRRALHLH